MDSSHFSGHTSLAAVMDSTDIDGLISTGVLSELSELPGPRTGTFCAFSIHTHTHTHTNTHTHTHTQLSTTGFIFTATAKPL